MLGAKLARIPEPDPSKLGTVTTDRQQPAKHAEQPLWELLQSAPEAILQLDEEGRIVFLNRMVEQMVGYTRAELLGETIETLVPRSLRGIHKRRRKQYLEQPVTRSMGPDLKLKARRKDGSLFPVEISLGPVISTAGVHVAAIVHDVTERRQMEQQHIRELELRNSEVERANRLKTEFLSNMSHELRSPLHTVLGFAELLSEEVAGPLNEKQRRFVDHIHKDSQHLLELLNDLLDLSKIESGHLDLKPEACDIVALLDEAISSLQSRAAAKSIDLQTDVPAPLSICADHLRFKQILYNLLANAIRFTPEHGRVCVAAAPRDGFVEISVTDTGIGIAPEQHEAVFDKFYQVRTATNGGGEGAGLGLAISKALVEQHGGRIRVNSRPGEGCCFTFTLPMATS